MDMVKDIDKDKDMDTIFCFSSNRNKPKLSVFWLCFSFFNKNKKIGLFRCFRTVSRRTETKNQSLNTNRNRKLCNGHGHFSFVLVCFELSLGVSVISKRRNKLF